MKRILIALLFMTTQAFAAPDGTMTIPNSFSPNTKIYSSAVNSNNNEIQSKFNAHSHTDITALGTVTVGSWAATIVTPAYGGTGKDLSAATQGCILFISDTGKISQLSPGTTGYFLQGKGDGVNPDWAAGGDNSDQIVRGFEVDAMTTSTCGVSSGDLFYGTTRINKTASTTLTFATTTDWFDSVTYRRLSQATYAYIGVGSGGGIKLMPFWATPNRADSVGKTTQSASLYYATYQSVAGQWDYWRIIGRVHLNASNTVDQKYVQVGNTLYLQRGIRIAVPIVHDVWGKVDLRASASLIDGEGQFIGGAYGVAGTYQVKPIFVTDGGFGGTTNDAEVNGGTMGWVFITNGAYKHTLASTPSVQFKSSYAAGWPATINAVRLTIR